MNIGWSWIYTYIQHEYVQIVSMNLLFLQPAYSFTKENLGCLHLTWKWLNMLHDILKHGLWNRWLNICVTLSKLLNPAWSLKPFIHNLGPITGNKNAIFTRWLWLLTEIIHEIYLRLNGCSINMNFLSLPLLPFLDPPKIYIQIDKAVFQLYKWGNLGF